MILAAWAVLPPDHTKKHSAIDARLWRCGGAQLHGARNAAAAHWSSLGEVEA